jgi:hypothetical protein
MKRRLLFALLVGTSLSACGGSGAASPTPSPVGPVAPPTVDVSGHWVGNQTDSTGPENIFWQLSLAGNSLAGSGGRSGTNQAGGGDRGLTISGTLSGSTLTFTVKWGVTCQRTISGTANVATAAISGTYNGSSCNESIANGTLTLRRFDLTGTWSGGMLDLRPSVGPGPFVRQGITWQLTQSGDSVTGSMPDPDPLNPNMVPITGTFLTSSSTLTFTSTYQVSGVGKMCPETLIGTAKLDLGFAPNVNLNLSGPGAVLNGTYTGGNCFTSITGGGVSLTKGQFGG